MDNIVFKIHGGTRNDKEGLCKTCSNSIIRKGSGDSQELVECSWGGDAKKVPFKIIECNRYTNASQPSIYDMQEIAWTIESKKDGKRIGFLSPSERNKQNGQPQSN